MRYGDVFAAVKANVPAKTEHVASRMYFGKIIAALLVGMLEDEKRIVVSEPVSKYLPELDDSDWKDIRLIDVLDMASGMGGLEFDDPKAYTDPDSPYGRFEASLGTMPRRPGTPVSTHDYVRDRKSVV